MNKKLVIGFALDGHPIYGNRDFNGKQITAKKLGITEVKFKETLGVN